MGLVGRTGLVGAATVGDVTATGGFTVTGCVVGLAALAALLASIPCRTIEPFSPSLEPAYAPKLDKAGSACSITLVPVEIPVKPAPAKAPPKS